MNILNIFSMLNIILFLQFVKLFIEKKGLDYQFLDTGISIKISANP